MGPDNVSNSTSQQLRHASPSIRLLFSSLQDSPPPNAYNVSRTFGKANGHSYLQPQSKIAKLRQSCFLSAAPRDDVIFPCDPSVPGIVDKHRTVLYVKVTDNKIFKNRSNKNKISK